MDHARPHRLIERRVSRKIYVGSVPIGGRGDESPFTDFVTSVFEWANISQPEHALRIYWEEMKERKTRSQTDTDTPPTV